MTRHKGQVSSWDTNAIGATETALFVRPLKERPWMDKTKCCEKCGKRMTSMVITDNGRTDFICAYCDNAIGTAEDVNLPVVDATSLSLVPGHKQ
jgi:hypothetical protein